MIQKWRFLAGLLVVGCCIVIALAAWKLSTSERRSAAMPAVAATPGGSVAKGGPDELDPVLVVLSRGGTTREIEVAIGILDTMVRTRKGLTEQQRSSILTALERGTPAGMAEGSWFHIFNSACNGLAAAQAVPDEALLGLLERTALHDPRLVMRLYALQHLACRYDAAGPASQQRMRSLVQGLVSDSSSQTAGTALVLWRRWERIAGPGAPSSLEMSRAIAADGGRPVDVRVTALQAIGG